MTKSRTNADNVTADIAGITAGTGITGGGTSGTVTITNDMATTIAAAGDLIYGTANDAYAALSLGTAGKVLKVNSGATAPEWAVDPTTDVVTTAGDLIYGTGADAVARLGIGTAGQLLKVNSGATAPEWGAAPTAGANWSLLNSGGTALTGAATVTVSGISGKDKIMVLVENASSNTNSNVLYVRFNTDTGSNYYQYGFKSDLRSSYDAGTQAKTLAGSSVGILLAEMGIASADASGFVLITGCNSSGVKVYNAAGGSTYQGSQATQSAFGGYYNSASTISSVSVNTGGGNWDAGTVYVYTSA